MAYSSLIPIPVMYVEVLCLLAMTDISYCILDVIIPVESASDLLREYAMVVFFLFLYCDDQFDPNPNPKYSIHRKILK